MKSKVLTIVFIIICIALLCYAGSFDTQLLQAGMIH